MSIKSTLIKKVIKWTPSMMMIWVANIVLKGIAEVTELNVDLDERTTFVQLQLFGETEVIEVGLEGFAVIYDGEVYRLMIKHAQSNRPWMNTILSRIIGKAWKIPAIPQLAVYLPLLTELVGAQTPDEEEVV